MDPMDFVVVMPYLCATTFEFIKANLGDLIPALYVLFRKAKSNTASSKYAAERLKHICGYKYAVYIMAMLESYGTVIRLMRQAQHNRQEWILDEKMVHKNYIDFYGLCRLFQTPYEGSRDTEDRLEDSWCEYPLENLIPYHLRYDNRHHSYQPCRVTPEACEIERVNNIFRQPIIEEPRPSSSRCPSTKRAKPAPLGPFKRIRINDNHTTFISMWDSPMSPTIGNDGPSVADSEYNPHFNYVPYWCAAQYAPRLTAPEETASPPMSELDWTTIAADDDNNDSFTESPTAPRPSTVGNQYDDLCDDIEVVFSALDTYGPPASPEEEEEVQLLQEILRPWYPRYPNTADTTIIDDAGTEVICID